MVSSLLSLVLAAVAVGVVADVVDVANVCGDVVVDVVPVIVGCCGR